MRRLFIILLFISILTNLVFLVRWNGRRHLGKENMKLHTYKKISFNEGYKALTAKLEKRYPLLNIKAKNSFICFWDSSAFESFGIETMEDMDSLAGALGKYSYNYIYATEMREEIAKAYLKRSGASPENLSIVGDMDDFISGIYCTYPGKQKTIFLGDTTKRNKCFNMFRHLKTKPFYLVMDTSGKVLYYNNKYFLPSKDTALVRVLKGSVMSKPLEKL